MEGEGGGDRRFAEVLVDDLTKYSSLLHQVWIGCVYVRAVGEGCRIDLLPTALNSVISLQTLIQEL